MITLWRRADTLCPCLNLARTGELEDFRFFQHTVCRAPGCRSGRVDWRCRRCRERSYPPWSRDLFASSGYSSGPCTYQGWFRCPWFSWSGAGSSVPFPHQKGRTPFLFQPFIFHLIWEGMCGKSEHEAWLQVQIKILHKIIFKVLTCAVFSSRTDVFLATAAALAGPPRC